jgi:hypothetical protein
LKKIEEKKKEYKKREMGINEESKKNIEEGIGEFI